MEDREIKNIWKKTNSKMEDKMDILFDEIKELKMDKAKMLLKGLLIRRILEAVAFMVLFFMLLKFMVLNYSGTPYIIAALALAVFTTIGYIGSLKQVKLILELNYAAPVTSFQVRLEKLKAFSLQTLRLLLLSIPFYFAYTIIGFKVFLDIDIYNNGDQNWLTSNLILSILLVPLSIWIYRKLSLKTKSRWVKAMVRDNGGKEIHSAMQFIREVEELQKIKLPPEITQLDKSRKGRVPLKMGTLF